MNILVRLWGKARPPLDRPSPSYHPLICHSLDVAAVGQMLLARWPALRRRLAALMGLEPEHASQLLIHLLALHDIGKFARAFQAKSLEHYPSELFQNLEGKLKSYDHASGGFHLLMNLDGLRKGLPPWNELSLIAAAVMGHHGSPPRGSAALDIADELPGDSRLLLDFFAESVRGLLPPPVVRLDRRKMVRASLLVAGFAVVCDWLGSNEDWFRYKHGQSLGDLKTYWGEALACAEKAVAEAGLLPSRAAPPLTFAQLTWAEFPPSPMQRWAQTVELPEGPLLFVLEDETGSGKTEAALILAHRLISAGRAEGFYMALPTMATANAMYARLAKLYRRLFAAEASPSVALVHGKRDLVKDFREARLAGGRRESSFGPDGEYEPASAACAEWIADDRRRAFLADAGAGTIDQAALSVLPTRYQSLRLFGLASKVLIVDEVHAYDDYVEELLEGLLAFQGALGGSAILLSATLPAGIRGRLVAAFAAGAQGPPADEPSPAYPRATRWARSTGSDAIPIEGRAERARTVPVRLLATVDQAYDEIAAARKRGLYLRNTVSDALEADRQLRERGLDTVVFHSRFAVGDRLEREREVLSRFGATSQPKDRGTVLVATQVAEQSLDLDFDLIVTDLAPIDLVIQRAGRLWRHARRDRLGSPELLVVSPVPVDEPGAGWYSRLLPRAAYVYAHHGRLWQTARLLTREGAIRTPQGMRALVEAVYGEAAEDIPEPLMAGSLEVEGKESGNRNQARANTLKLSSGYHRDGGAWDVEERAPTRLGDPPQVTIRLARIDGEKIVPWYRGEGDEIWRAWALSEVNFPASGEPREAIASEYSAAAAIARREWTKYDEEKIMLPLRPAGHRWIGKGRLSKWRREDLAIFLPIRIVVVRRIRWVPFAINCLGWKDS